MNCGGGNRGASWGPDDTIVFSAAGGASGLLRVPASGGEPTTLTTPDAQKGETGHSWPEFLPGGQAILFNVLSGGARDPMVAVRDLKTGTQTILVRDPALDQFPVWTPDGRRIAFASSRAGGNPNIFWQAADGTGAAERLTTAAVAQYPWAFTPDGRSLVIRDTGLKTGPDISIISMEGDHAPRPLIHSAYNEQNAVLSADGRRIAYQSNESGHDEIHVRPFPAVDSGHWQISTDGGSRPLWAPSGRELFYVDDGARIMVVPIQTSPAFAAGSPSVALAGDVALPTVGRSFDISPDGRRFLVIKNAPRDDSNPTQLHVVLNWGEEFKRLAPVKH